MLVVVGLHHQRPRAAIPKNGTSGASDAERLGMAATFADRPIEEVMIILRS